MADYLNMIKIIFFSHCEIITWCTVTMGVLSLSVCWYIESLVHLKQMSFFGQRLPNGISDRISSQLSGILITSGLYLPTFYNPALML